MKSWEFLLQKEGDRTWLPLENTTVEILEGRYRVVARTPCPKGNVDIYVSFVSSEDDPPKRRIQQRSRSANDDGLLAILPFTPFRPGLWELRCRPHVEAGDSAQQWHSQIQLQVLYQEGLGDGDLFGWDQPQADVVQPGATEPGAAEPGAIESEAAQPQTLGPEVTGLDSIGLDTAAEGIAATAGPSAHDLANDLSATASAPPPQAQPQAQSGMKIDPATASDADIQRLAEEMSQMVMESVLGADAATASSPPATAETLDTLPPAPGLASQAAYDSVQGDRNAAVAPAMASFATAEAVSPENGSVESGSVETTGPEAAAKPTVDLTVDLTLDEAVLVMDSDRQITVTGQVIFPLPAAPSTAASPSELVLTLELRDPSTKEIWVSQRDSFRPALDPQAFETALQVPSACLAQLLIGNATLWRVGEDGTLEHLLRRDFNAMAAVDTLLDFARQSGSIPGATLQGSTVGNLQQQAASNFLLAKFGSEPRPAKGSVQLNTELLNLLKPGARAADSSARPSGSDATPVRVIVESDRPRLELPKFGNPVPVSRPVEARDATEFGSSMEQAPSHGAESDIPDGDALDPASFDKDHAGLSSTELDILATAPDAPRSAGLDGLSDWSLTEDNPFVLPPDGSLSELDSRLGDLAVESDGTSSALTDATATVLPALSDELGAALATEPGLDPGFDLGQADATTDALSLNETPDSAGKLAVAEEQGIISKELNSQFPSSQNAESFSHEVVVDDDDAVPAAKLDWMQPPDENQVDEDISVPVPELTVPDSLLVQGETIRIQVRVAQAPARLCARVWRLDCQSRTLMGEPQWITAFLPLGQDWMEANVDWVIPEGSIELQMEAIAVEPITQRESRKVSVRRKVTLTTERPDNGPL